MAETVKNQLKQALRDGTRVHGVWLQSGSSVVAEALGWTGHDFVVLDMEHAPIDIPVMLGLLQAVAGTPAASLVRPPWNDMVLFKQLLDIGCQNLLVPNVRSAEEAKAAVSYTRYPPDGVRGMVNQSRANRFGTVEGYHHRAAEELCVVVQLETKQAMDDFEAISAVTGIDSVFVGPNDLSADMGLMGELEHEDVQGIIARVGARAKELGRPAGILASSLDKARVYLEMGYSWAASGSDLAYIMNGATEQAERIRTGT